MHLSNLINIYIYICMYMYMYMYIPGNGHGSPSRVVLVLVLVLPLSCHWPSLTLGCTFSPWQKAPMVTRQVTRLWRWLQSPRISATIRAAPAEHNPPKLRAMCHPSNWPLDTQALGAFKGGDGNSWRSDSFEPQNLETLKHMKTYENIWKHIETSITIRHTEIKDQFCMILAGYSVFTLLPHIGEEIVDDHERMTAGSPAIGDASKPMKGTTSRTALQMPSGNASQHPARASNSVWSLRCVGQNLKQCLINDYKMINLDN